MVGGFNVLHADARYTYQSLKNEFHNEFGVNGNQSPELGCQLLTCSTGTTKHLPLSPNQRDKFECSCYGLYDIRNIWKELSIGCNKW